MNTSTKVVDKYLESQVNGGRTPGAHYAMFQPDSTVHEKMVGLKNIKVRQPIDPLTTFHLYSITKTFTALAILQLMQQGKVNLNEQVSHYLKSFSYPTEITIEQLLNHTSGIPNPLPLKWIHLPAEHEGFDRDAFLSKVISLHKKLAFKPGTKFRYTNLGYVLLGQVIEKISGTKFEAFITQNIFNQCNIEDNELGFTIKPEIHAAGYQKYFSLLNATLTFMIDKSKYMSPHERAWQAFKLFYNNGVAYGGMTGSARGLVKYGQALLRNDGSLLNQEYKDLMFRENRIGGKTTGMTMSWFKGTLEGQTYFTHAGGGGGYYAELRLYPHLNIGSVILLNRTGIRDERMLDKIDRLIITKDFLAETASNLLNA